MELSVGDAVGAASTASAVEDARLLLDPPLRFSENVSLWLAFDGLALAARGALAAATGLLR